MIGDAMSDAHWLKEAANREAALNVNLPIGYDNWEQYHAELEAELDEQH